MTSPSSSDEKLRDLERRFRQTGSPDDEAAWLLERVRVGAPLDWFQYVRLSELAPDQASCYLRGRIAICKLSNDQLALAALIGHIPAAMALNESRAKPPSFDDWIVCVLRATKEVGDRAGQKRALLLSLTTLAKDMIVKCTAEHQETSHADELEMLDLVAARVNDPEGASEERLRGQQRYFRSRFGIEHKRSPHTLTALATVAAAMRETVGAQERIALTQAARSQGEEAVKSIVRSHLLPSVLGLSEQSL